MKTSTFEHHQGTPLMLQDHRKQHFEQGGQTIGYHLHTSGIGNFCVCLLLTHVRNVVYKENNIGLKAEICGTLNLSFHISDNEELILMDWQLSAN